MRIKVCIQGFIVLIGLLILSSCNEQASDINDEPSEIAEQAFSNKPIYHIKVGDTVKIYSRTNGAIAISYGLYLDSLNHLEYDGIEQINPEKWTNCDGCSLPFFHVFIGKSVGTDTLFDEIRDFSKHTKETLATYSHIIQVR